MSNHRRVVRVSRDVFDELDLVLGPGRGEDGTPSANDFLTIDLLPVVDAFATRFDDLPELIPGRPDYRILISGGVLVHAIAVAGQLVSDGTIEILKIRIELRS